MESGLRTLGNSSAQSDEREHGEVRGAGSIFPLGAEQEPTVLPADEGTLTETAPLDNSRALALADFAPVSSGPVDAALRWAYRIGVPGSLLAAPFRKPAKLRLLATVESPLEGDRAAGMALRAGHFLVHGVRAPIAQMEFASSARLTPPFARVVHGFSWLRDLSSAASREQGVPAAERVIHAWLDANSAPRGVGAVADFGTPFVNTGRGPAWSVENAGHRLLAWLVHAPLVLSGENESLRPRVLEAIAATARWLDRHVEGAEDGLGALAGWCAIVAAGLLLPDGRPRRLFGEAGLLRALGEAVSDDGGVLSRSPLAQMETIALLIDLRACYEAVDRTPPRALETMLTLLMPPLLALRHGDGGLGSWQGAGATSAAALAALVEASGVRARPGKDMRQWGYQHVAHGKSVLQFDAAPPPRRRHARFGCASTLAFEFSQGEHRIIVNCGGAALAGGQVPARIEQGLRATAAHSTLVLDDANSTAVLIKGEIGKGVEEVDITRAVIEQPARRSGQAGRKGTRLEACHDGYASRFALIHRRILVLSDDGRELRGEDVLDPAGKRGQRGKIGFAIRFHIGPGIELGLSEDRRGAGLALPDGSYWQLRLGGEEGELAIEESLWVDGQGRPQPIQQLVVEGLASRSGGRFPWLLKQMG